MTESQSGERNNNKCIIRCIGFLFILFPSHEGPTLETLDYSIRIGSTHKSKYKKLYFDLYLYSANAAHYVYMHTNKPDVQYQCMCGAYIYMTATMMRNCLEFKYRPISKAQNILFDDNYITSYNRQENYPLLKYFFLPSA